jgi:ArsR family transcriptional regulator
MKEFIKVMKALSDSNRVKLVKMLQKRAMYVCEVQAALGISQPTVSKHLKILEGAGLVDRRKEGLWVNYSLLANGGRSPYAASLLGNLVYWLADDPGVRDLIERSEAIRRENLWHAWLIKYIVISKYIDIEYGVSNVRMLCKIFCV